LLTFIRSVLVPGVVMAEVCADILAVEEAAAAPEFAMSGNAKSIVRSSHTMTRATKTREP
jgi:hypothetical protein